jgi:hypothetical protein
MRSFEIRDVGEIKAREPVEQLFIDGIGQIDAFEEELKGTTFLSELRQLLAYIEHFANGNSIGSKLVVLKNPIAGGMEYEFKSKHLRIYAVQRPGKKVVIYCGKKKKADSSDNIAEFRRLKQQYLWNEKN